MPVCVNNKLFGSSELGYRRKLWEEETYAERVCLYLPAEIVRNVILMKYFCLLQIHSSKQVLFLPNLVHG